jgi:uncharacterized protein (TIGR00266 family)
MQFEILERPSYAVLEVSLERGEEIAATPGAMVTRTPDVVMEANVGGGDGIGAMVERAVSDRAGPGLVETVFSARHRGGTVTLAPDYPGDVAAIDVTETGPLRAQTGSALAWQPVVERAPAGETVSSGTPAVVLRGRGRAFLSSFGALTERTVTPDEPLVGDEDHLVAWTADLDADRRRTGGVKTGALGGEGTVLTLSGKGRAWVQTRDPASFGQSEAARTRSARGRDRETEHRPDRT